MRRIGIVALARRLLIALWRNLEDGVRHLACDSAVPAYG
jgi:hypothetical protein